MALAGDFREIAFSDVVQLYCHSRRTAMLVVHCAKTGKALGFFYFEGGELVDAKLEDAEALDAVYRAMELKEGTFHVVLDARAPQRRIFEPVGAMLLEGMRRMDEASYVAEAGGAAPKVLTATPPPREVPLKLVRSPVGDQEPDQGEGDQMTGAELKGRVCPACGKHFISGEVCPDDGVRLVVPGGPISIETPPSRTVPPPAALSRRASPTRGWWIAVAGLLVVLIALGVVWVRRPRDGGAGDEPAAVRTTPPPAPSPQPAGAAVAAPVAEAPRPAPVEAAKAPAPAPAPPAVPTVRGVTDKEILFGMAAPFTGSAKELGRQMKLGVEIAFSSINEAGGIHGRNLRLVAADDGYEPARTIEVMKELTEKTQIFGIIGNVGTPTAVVAVPYALDHKLLFYGAFTGASLLRRDPPDRYVFNYRASYAEETAAVVKYLVKVRHLRPDQIAVFAQQDAYGDAGYAGVQKAMRGLRGDSGNTLRVGYKRNTIDVLDAVARLREHPIAIKAIVMVPTYRAAAKFIEKVRDLYPAMIFTAVSFVGSTALAEELNLLGPKYASGVIVTQVVPPVESHSTAILKYKAALAKYFPGENPDYVSLEGYLAAMVMAEGLQRAGRDLDTEKLVDAMEQIHGLDLGIGTQIGFGLAEHQGSHKVWGTMLQQDGTYKAIELE